MLCDLFGRRKTLQQLCVHRGIHEEYYVYGKINIFFQLDVHGETCDKKFNITKLHMYIFFMMVTD